MFADTLAITVALPRPPDSINLMIAIDDGGMNRSVAQILNTITSMLHSFNGSFTPRQGLTPQYRTLAPEVWGDAIGRVLTSHHVCEFFL